MIGSQYIDEMRRIASKMIEDAKRLQTEGNFDAAARALRGAAQNIRKMADKHPVYQDRIRLFQNAVRAEEKAALFEQGKPAFEDDGNEGPKDSIPAEDEYRASVDELIYRADVTWDDIGGMDEVKATLKYTLGLMLARAPEGVRLSSASRILLYGPPGTGKTLLAAACSNMIGATFFNVKASDLLSKYFGESTKLISALYARARSETDTGASLIFIDEFDALCRQRGGSGETGAERRILSTLLAELDGLADKGEVNRVITIIATNAPWDMDEAITDRFEKHILVDLPEAKARKDVFKILIEGDGLKIDGSLDYEVLAERSDGFSGRLISRACKLAIDHMVREQNVIIPSKVDDGSIKEHVACIRPLSVSDFDLAFSKVKVSASIEILEKYRSWATRIGGDRT